jgi:glutamate carboxypeptidase
VSDRAATELDRVEQDLLARAAVRERRMREELAEWVAIPTGWGHRAGIDAQRTLIADRLAALGAELRLEPGDPRPEWLAPSHGGDGSWIPETLVARRSGAGRAVLLCGHLDTVHDPHGTFDRLHSLGGDRATGPGCADMKGGLLVALHALEILDAADLAPPWSFLLNADEETGSFHSARTLHDGVAGHAAGLVFEPALPGGGLAVARMGAGQFRIEVTGRAAHVGREFERGISSVYALGEALVRLSTLSDPPAGRIVNVGPIEGGRATNVVPDRARAWGNVRFGDGRDAEALAAAVGALATAGDALPRVQVEWLANRPAKPRTPAVERLAEETVAIGAALGAAIEPRSTGGVCDGNILQAAGLPTIDTLGVRGGNLHRHDEFVELDSLVERAALSAILIKRIAEGRVVE